ncbi:20942_t:CDS:1, partial [Racocetra persica]
YTSDFLDTAKWKKILAIDIDRTQLEVMPDCCFQALLYEIFEMSDF